jgi:predicted ATP-grasp superfamily ATP-dependent carboligase
VLVVGVSTRAMAESAAKAGFSVTSLDAFGDLDQHAGVHALSLPRDFGVPFSARTVADAARTIEADALAYLSPFENHPSVVDELARGRALWGNSSSTLRGVRPRFHLPPAHQRVKETKSGSDPARWLLKPRASGGGHGIRWWNPGDPVPTDSYVQPYVEGEPGSIVFAAASGNCVPLGLTRQLIGDWAFGADGFRYCGSILYASAPTRLGDSSVLLAREIAQRFALVGVNCIDFIAQDDAAVPIEINPRWSASMELVERAYGLSVFGIHAAACTRADLPQFDITHARATRAAIGKAIVFARRDIACGDTSTWLDDSDIRDVPHPGEHIAEGRPVCTVFATGDDVDSCRANLVERARAVDEIIDSWSSVAV